MVHTDNCPTQYKCRQKFWHVAVGAEDNGSRIMHQFAQKYGFKGSWDATGKQIKTLILRNENSSLCCANALDCYLRLTRDLENMGHEKKQEKWLDWEKKKDYNIVEKTVFKSNRTFVGLVVETEEEKQSLLAKNHKHIVLTNRSSIPNMRPIPETLKQFQIQGDYMAIINEKGQKQWKLHSSEHPCSCPNCCQYKPGNGFETWFLCSET